MPEYRPVEQEPWRQPRPGELLDDLPVSTGGVIAGRDRCSAIGLGHTHSPCSMPRYYGSAYCYYHDKLQEGLTTPHVESYVVWPLPKNGYRLLAQEQRLAVAA